MSLSASAENLTSDNQVRKDDPVPALAEIRKLQDENWDLFLRCEYVGHPVIVNWNCYQSCGDGSNMCLELALEGERLCKAGDCRAGVAFFQAAIQAGTDDLRTLSAIYSQLGNAYFYLGDYSKAMQYHKHDLTLAR